jgi:hypothetical protein
MRDFFKQAGTSHYQTSIVIRWTAHWQEELAKEQEALLNSGGGDDGGWQSDPDEEEFFRREAELAAETRISGDGDGQGAISSFIENLSVE